jgi:hypothetical protein
VNIFLPLSNLDFSWFFNKSVFLIVSSIIAVMILNSNFQMGLIRESLLSADAKLIIFSLYVITFILTGIILLKVINQTSKENIKSLRQRVYSISIFLAHIILSITLVLTIRHIYSFSGYSDLVFYVTSYVSFISSIAFLMILSFKFFRLFSHRKNYLTLAYGILFTLFYVSVLLMLIYLIDGLAVHPPIIKYVPPRELVAGQYSVNIQFQDSIAITYDILFFISFILAWILSVLILKQYIVRIGKYKFWLLASIPLIFHLIRYETILNLDTGIIEFGSNIIPSSVGQAIFIALMNSDIQLSAIFFGLSFLIIALKLKNTLLRRIMMVTVIGIMLLFGSRDLHSLFVSSIPPGGVVTISFMSIASYMLLTSLVSFLKLASRDKQLYNDLIHRVEKDSVLLRNLVFSEKRIATIEVTKPLMDFSSEWQKTHSYEELSREEVKDLINDVMLELKEKKLKNKLNGSSETKE